MEKIIATKNLDNLITKVEAARLRVSEHHIVKIVGISKYWTAEYIKNLYEVVQLAFRINIVQDLKYKYQFLD